MSDRPHVLLVAARAARPSPATRARVRAALEAQLYPPPPTANTQSPPAPTTTGAIVGTVTKLVLVTLIAGGATAAAVERPTSTATATSAAAFGGAPARPSASAVTLPLPSTSTSTSTSPKPRPVAVDPFLQLRKADELLRAGDANRALEIVRPLRQRESVREEVEAIEALAACALHHDDAEARASRFITAHGSSPYATRVRSKCLE